MNQILQPEEKRFGALGNILAIAGFIIIIAIGLWGAINAVRFAPRIFSILAAPFSAQDRTLTITLPSERLESYIPFTITWTHNASEIGLYSFAYACAEGVQLDVQEEENSFVPVTCEMPYALPSTDVKSLTVRPLLSPGVNVVEVPFSVAYTNSNGEKRAEASASVTVFAATQTPTQPERPVTQTPPNTGTTPAKPAGPADLSVELIAHGVLDPRTRAFIPKPIVFNNEIAATRFQVVNRGGRASGSWMFEADLPTVPAYHYVSPIQASLNPADRIEFTLSFDRVVPGSIRIVADPNQTISESNRVNNQLTTQLIVQ